MPISKELYLSVLSLDAYNHGYNVGIEGLGGAGDNIGSATILNNPIPDGSQAAGFYAVAYNTPYGTVISYSGTDNRDILTWNDGGSDFWHGWLFGGGWETSQLSLARDFYEDVTSRPVFSTPAVPGCQGKLRLTVPPPRT